MNDKEIRSNIIKKNEYFLGLGSHKNRVLMLIWGSAFIVGIISGIFEESNLINIVTSLISATIMYSVSIELLTSFRQKRDFEIRNTFEYIKERGGLALLAISITLITAIVLVIIGMITVVPLFLSLLTSFFVGFTFLNALAIFAIFLMIMVVLSLASLLTYSIPLAYHDLREAGEEVNYIKVFFQEIKRNMKHFKNIFLLNFHYQIRVIGIPLLLLMGLPIVSLTKAVPLIVIYLFIPLIALFYLTYKYTVHSLAVGIIYYDEVSSKTI